MSENKIKTRPINMSAHLNVSGQVGGYNLENNTDPEFFNSVYNIFSKDAPESETESRHVDWLLPDRRIAEDTTVINYNMSKQKNKFTDLASIRIWGSVILEKKTKDEKWNEQDIRNRIYLLTTKLSSFNAILSPLFDAFSFSAFSGVVFLCFIVLHF